MEHKKYITLAVGIIFLIVAMIGISNDKPELYVVFLVLGFMFLFQGINALRKK